MSHDQRPGRMRIVDGAPPPERRRDGEGPAGQALVVVDTATPPVEADTPAPKAGLSILAVVLYLLSCAGGGFGAVALLRSMGVA